MDDLSVIVLAAGDGTRMKSRTQKLLHEVAGLPIVSHVVRAAIGAGAKDIGVVTAPGATSLQSAVREVAPKVRFFAQEERRGTAHAARIATDIWQNATGIIAVVYGDHPLLRAENFALVIDRIAAGDDVAILGFAPDDPSGYGRFITDGDRLLEIREHKDASAAEREIGLCNACILAFKADVFSQTITKVKDNNVQKEFYLGDLVILANAAGYKVGYAIAPTEDVLGVNSQSQLADAEAIFQQRLRAEMMANGVRLQDPTSVYFSHDTRIGQDVQIEPNVVFGRGVDIADGAHIKAFCHIEGANISEGAIVGPFARLRPGTDLAAGAKVGNFVEVKNAQVGPGAKLNHLSYIGDAEIGAAANIGAGTITCNYDGLNKHKTKIGAGVFVGSNSALVAPLTIADNAYIASGSVITTDVPEDGLAFGRARQENRDGYAPKLRARAAAFKADNK